MNNPAPGPIGAEQFGYAVAISGDRAVVAAPNAFGPTGAYGIVRVYNLAGSTPAVAALTLSRTGNSGHFGNDVALSDGSWTCGKDGQSVPVGVGCPTMKLSSITVGGTDIG